MFRKIKQITSAEYAPMGDLVTYRALPSGGVSYIDPFLLLNHHGPQVYPANNTGLPFGPHPHRGIETVTFIVEGDISHRDSSGHSSTIHAGGVQWMRAGKGLIHAEESSAEFMKQGGKLELLQLWINIPAKLKMSEPCYLGLEKNQLPSFSPGQGITTYLLAGNEETVKGAFEPLAPVHLQLNAYNQGSEHVIRVPGGTNIFFYVVRGRLNVNGTVAEAMQLVTFERQNGNLEISALSDSLLIAGWAEPLGENVVSGGPFVMNTEQEIQQAYEDYRSGKFGSWKE